MTETDPPFHAADVEAKPVDAALRAVSETRRMLESLVRSSEEFDYLGARAALAELRRKTRQLARLQARIEAARVLQPPNVRPVRFSNARQPQP